MNELIKAYEIYTPYTADQLAAMRPEKRKFSTKKILAYGSAILAVASFYVGYVGQNRLNTGHPQTVTEVVRPYEGAWNVVRRAEKDIGINPDSQDMRPIVDRVMEQYGPTLQPGQEIAITLEK